MTKRQAIIFFGSVNLTAEAIGVTAQAIDKWPEILTEGLEAKVIVAALRKYDGKLSKVKVAFPEFFTTD